MRFHIHIITDLKLASVFSIKSHLRGNHIDAWWACRCWHEHCSTETAVDHRSQVFYTRPPKLGAGVVPSPKAASSAQPHGAMRKKLSRGSPSRPSLLSAAFTNDGGRTMEKELQPAWWLRIPKQLFVYQLLCQTHDIALDDQRWIRNWLALHQIMVWLLRFCLWRENLILKKNHPLKFWTGFEPDLVNYAIDIECGEWNLHINEEWNLR